ncbi:hypothetical protein SAMN06265377_2270 [Flagellimonas pacifica]|uniref:Uncharacterized protein n=1 Tax=Flagellimonas pacifica TaxID=1247520 RepID=A0A285MXA3_9FLAO|nr:hypothetical protein SAMN06265377_2270 [Allomuricauda parva]
MISFIDINHYFLWIIYETDNSIAGSSSQHFQYSKQVFGEMKGNHE